MCRLLGVVSATAKPLTTLLHDDFPQFTALSSEHCDGWGIAHWDDGGELRVDKAPEAARPSAGYHAAARAAHTDAALLHLRKASGGMNNTAVNTHPFSTGRIAFAHNGWASDVPCLDAALAEAAGPACLGTTDSERYFGLVLAAMRTVSPEVALTGVAARIFGSMRTEALNCLLLTDDALYAFCRYDATRPTLSGRDPVESYRMGFRPAGDSVLVASSGWEHSAAPWEPLENGQVLRVGRRDLRLSVHRVEPAHALAALGHRAEQQPAAAG
jgi:predicted glutamine amidotransferase